MQIKAKIIKLLKGLNAFNKLNFIMLYGSYSKKKHTPMSDIDICISLDMDKKQRFGIRLKLTSELGEKYDIQIFEDLPLRVKYNALRGKLLYCKDKESLTLTAIRIKKEYADFYPRYMYYITGIKNVQRTRL